MTLRTIGGVAARKPLLARHGRLPLAAGAARRHRGLGRAGRHRGPQARSWPSRRATTASIAPDPARAARACCPTPPAAARAREAVTLAHDGARAVRHALDQARSGGRRVHACSPTRSSWSRPPRELVQRRLRGVPVLHRRPGHLPAPARRRLPHPDALGRADRLRPGPAQPQRAAHAARAPAGRAA